jgi:gamma-glutamylcysteine synthetase
MLRSRLLDVFAIKQGLKMSHKGPTDLEKSLARLESVVLARKKKKEHWQRVRQRKSADHQQAGEERMRQVRRTTQRMIGEVPSPSGKITGGPRPPVSIMSVPISSLKQI